MLSVIGTKVIQHISQLSNLQAAATEFEEQYGIAPSQVDGVDILGRCLRCKTWIFDGDTREGASDGWVCERCACVEKAANEPAAVESDPKVEVTASEEADFVLE